MRFRKVSSVLLVGLVACGGPPPLEPPAPEPPVDPASEAAARVASVEFTPSPLAVTVGDTVLITATLRDAQGAVVEGARWGVATVGVEAESMKERIPETYAMWGTEPGEATLNVFAGLPPIAGDQPNWQRVGSFTVEVRDYPVATVELDSLPYGLYTGTSFYVNATPRTASGEESTTASIRWSTSNPAVARVQVGGRLNLIAPGPVDLIAEAAGRTTTMRLDVVENPVRSLRLDPGSERVRTGDVVRLNPRLLNARGRVVEDAAVLWEVSSVRGEGVGSAQVIDGDFVAEEAGQYRISAISGTARRSIEIEVFPRNAERDATLVGFGEVGTATTDLWVFEGGDGRDYAYTGTMSAATMYAWDVTDPTRPVMTDSLTFDGRRINDVKINDAATLAIATSEGASNRQNGITLLDIRDPAHPAPITHYTQNLTGGVHNVWFSGDLVYAVNDGTLDVHIIDVSDPAAPREVGRWGLDNEERYLHDVSVVDGLAYLSYWDDGLVILDVGAGIKGGTPTEPAFVSSVSYRYAIGDVEYGNTHHAIRYGDYVFLGDEIFGCSECDPARGYIHVIDVSDIEHPVEVANFKLPDAGTHNLWVEDDLLYIAYYQGGLRVVDVSGELRGDLLAQGREVGVYLTEPSAGGAGRPMAWGPQPYKGNVFVSDMASGLWVVRLEPPKVIP